MGKKGSHPNKKKKVFWSILLGIALVYISARVYFRATDDFRVANMIHPLPHYPEWEIPEPTSNERDHVNAILQQNYTYIGKGAQSYAFGSEDGKYVLKFFKFKHLKPSLLVDLLPKITPFKEYKVNEVIRKKRKLYGVFTGYRLGYEVHKEESGLLYIHLNPVSKSLPVATVIDKIGRKRLIDLNDVVFVLQERAKTTRTIVNEALQAGNTALALQRIGQIFDLYIQEYKKGIFDKDHGVMHNTGFVGEQPIHLDIGKLIVEPNMKNPEYWQPDLELIARKFEVWIKANYPNEYPMLVQRIETQLSDHYGKCFHF